MMKVNRREFLHKVGAGSIALASLPALMDVLKQPALGQMAQTERGYMFLTVSAAGPQHLIAMGGAGRFDPSRGSGSVTGGGTYAHFQPAASPPFPIVAAGKWTARLLTSYRELAPYGSIAAGVGEFVIDIQRVRPSPASIRGAVLTIFCTLGPAGITAAQTGGQIEGINLSIPGTEFSAGGNPGPFRQIASPPPAGSFGLTVFQLPEGLA